jgi:hypothetical protein
MKIIASMLMALCLVASTGLVATVAKAEDAGQNKTEAQDLLPAKGLDPSVCTGLQKQIDQVMNIAGSSLTDTEKVAQLSQMLAQSMAAMTKSSGDDAEVDRIVKQYQFFIQSLLTAALATGSSNNNNNVSASANDELQKFKTLTANYVAMAKILCPDVKLPDVINK